MSSKSHSSRVTDSALSSTAITKDVPVRKIGFLFNHEHVHQIPHAATVGFVLSTLSASAEVCFITSSRPQLEYLKRLERDYPQHKCSYITISIPAYLRTIGAVLDKAIPFTKIALLKLNLPVFKSLDALVVPEKTSILLRSQFGLRNLKFIYTAHGAGDRAIGFDKHTAEFDLVFLSGPKIKQRMEDVGILKKTASCIIGYPKFDAVHAFSRKRTKIFDNDRLTVLYNPHFSPHLSSWYKMGINILEYFYNSDIYNLVFAPHVMLYRRKMHLSQEKLSLGRVRSIPQKYRDCRHIHIDTGSAACTDMTYTLASDLYLGDVSSQVWEFLVEPKPCLFANAHNVNWENDPNYLYWHTGPVFNDIEKLHDTLQLAISTHNNYRTKQEELFRYTFDVDGETSSIRAARAILEFLDQSSHNSTG